MINEYFERPDILWGLLWAFLIVCIYGIYRLRQNRKFDGPWVKSDLGYPIHYPMETQRSGILQTFFQFLALCCAIIALAQPQWGEVSQIEKTMALDLVVAMDISQSMNAEDLAPNRLGKARAAISKTLKELGPDRVGLVVFAGQAQTILPLTPDHGAIELFLSSIDTSLMTYQGTNLKDVTREVMSLFKTKDPETDAERVLLLFTDGEDTIADDLESFRELVGWNVRIYPIGVGTAKGVPIPERDSQGQLKGYKKTAKGEVVTTKLNENLLKKIADIGMGQYFVLTQTSEELSYLVDALKNLKRAETESQGRIRRQERYWIFLGVAILLWAISLFQERIRHILPFALGIFCFTSSFGQNLDYEAWKQNKQGLKSLKNKKPEQAIQDFLSAQEHTKDGKSSNRIQYNVGKSLEAQKNLEEAQKAFEAAAQGDDPEARARAQYALGNLAAAKGQNENALRHYQESLKELKNIKESPEWTKDLSHNIQTLLNSESDQNSSSSQDKGDEDQSKNQSQEDKQQNGQDAKNEESKKSDEHAQGDGEKENEPKDEEPNPQDSPKPPPKSEAKDENSQPGPKKFESMELSPQEAKQLLNSLLESEKGALKSHFERDQKKKGKRLKPEKDW